MSQKRCDPPRAIGGRAVATENGNSNLRSVAPPKKNSKLSWRWLWLRAGEPAVLEQGPDGRWRAYLGRDCIGVGDTERAAVAIVIAHDRGGEP
jgi:hypothetical protein